MNSCLYKAQVMHHRLTPKVHRFHYNIFMFYLDLDEIDQLHKKSWFISRNRFNIFNFRDKDHLQLPKENPDTSKNVRQHITNYLKENNVEIGNGKIMLLTNLCTLGYQFNPVSFYFCYDENDQPICAVVETCNTYLEMKPFFLGNQNLSNSKFQLKVPKYFYVSPFIDMDTFFDFNLQIPDEKLSIKIDDHDKQGNRFFISTLNGKRKALNDKNLLLYFISFPFITIKVITLIHWQALKLWLKKLPYHPKASNKELQRDVYRPYQSN